MDPNLSFEPDFRNLRRMLERYGIPFDQTDM